MGAGLVGGRVGLAFGVADQIVGEQIGFHFVAADVRQHFAVYFHAGTEHLAAFFNHFLALDGVVDDVAVFKGQIVFAHDGADTLAPAAGGLQVGDNFWLIHIFKSASKVP